MSRTVSIYLKTDENQGVFLERLSEIFSVVINPVNSHYSIGYFVKPEHSVSCTIINKQPDPIYHIDAYSLMINPWGKYNPKRPFAETQGRVARYVFDFLKAYGQYPLLMLINSQRVRDEFNWPKKDTISGDHDEEVMNDIPE